MTEFYKNILILHCLDKTTEFLLPFKAAFPRNYLCIEPNNESIQESLKQLKDIEQNSLIIFLGHGYSAGLYSPESNDFEKHIIINVDIGNSIFADNDVLLLSCNSNQYLRKINTYNKIIGFGNILSSMDELMIEAENITGEFRKLKTSDINYFNSTYVNSIINATKILLANRINFDQLPTYIEYFINKSIVSTLKDRNKVDRVEIARLLFEFRNEMTFVRKNKR